MNYSITIILCLFFCFTFNGQKNAHNLCCFALVTVLPVCHFHRHMLHLPHWNHPWSTDCPAYHCANWQQASENGGHHDNKRHDHFRHPASCPRGCSHLHVLRALLPDLSVCCLWIAWDCMCCPRHKSWTCSVLSESVFWPSAHLIYHNFCKDFCKKAVYFVGFLPFI